MSNEGRKNKPVSFNINDEHDLALLNHAEQTNTLTGKPRNFSKYVKRLIEEDMKRGQKSEIRIDRNEPIVIEETYSIETKEAMNSFI
ncbi:hypothetical protein [Lysinibacillus fusiformis]|uniref:hypothetical protein n=1 Tax=Lysinibacillus fusiformis TaxID=28031 RepID=UPI00215A895B|nr:hypothetical protein [Lysinibacillus fusiformis]MCR8855308.1 hypothetical protein [Lysinibacillus fusiformis]WKT76076.1 hypothetical protein QYY55_18635 [Lysinibacillus fusiformis]